MLINISTPSPLPNTQVTGSPDDTATVENSSSLTFSLNGDVKGSANAGGGDQAAPLKQDSETVKQLKKQIEQLQKLLQQQQQALQKAQASTQDADAKAVAVAAAQLQIAGTAAALQTVASALLQAVTDEGSDSSGSMVSTTA